MDLVRILTAERYLLLWVRVSLFCLLQMADDLVIGEHISQDDEVHVNPAHSIPAFEVEQTMTWGESCCVDERAAFHCLLFAPMGIFFIPCIHASCL